MCAYVCVCLVCKRFLFSPSSRYFLFVFLLKAMRLWVNFNRWNDGTLTVCCFCWLFRCWLVPLWWNVPNKIKKSWFVCLLFACKTNVCSFFLFNGSSFHIRSILYYVYMAMFRFAVEIQNCSLFRWWCWWWWEYKTAKETKRMKGERKKKLANQINKKIHNQNIACSQII